jgi:proline dehydrogenase
MKTILPTMLLASVFIIAWGCGKKSHDHDQQEHGAGDAIEEGGNQALYDEVMKVHDEVMPKMNDIYKLKEELKNQIANTPEMVEEKQKEIEAAILKLDSASEGMMVWMRNFNPLPDSLGEEQAKEYLENEMEKVKKVRAEILEALEKAKGGT